MFKALLSICATIALCYASMAFYQWEWCPGLWSAPVRGVTVMLAIVGAAVVLIDWEKS